MEELAKRFADLADRFAPSVADAAKSAARMEAYSSLASGALLILAAIVVAFLANWFRYKAGAAGSYDSDPWVFGMWLAIAAALILLASGAWPWLDPWTWATINHPELWLAKKAFHL